MPEHRSPEATAEGRPTRVRTPASEMNLQWRCRRSRLAGPESRDCLAPDAPSSFGPDDGYISYFCVTVIKTRDPVTNRGWVTWAPSCRGEVAAGRHGDWSWKLESFHQNQAGSRVNLLSFKTHPE